MKKPFLVSVILALFVSIGVATHAADASYKHWRGSMKAAEQARLKRDFDTMRQILEGSAAEARQLGPLSSADNAYWLAIAYTKLRMDDQALTTFDQELERIGPKPTATKLQIIRGVLLTERGILLHRVGDNDKALQSALDGKAVLEDAAGKFHPELYGAHQTIGRIHLLRNEFPQAEESMRMALKLAETRETHTQTEWSGSEQATVMYSYDPSPARVTLAATDLGRVYAAEGKLEEAESAFKKALKNAEAGYPKESIMREIPLRWLAEMEFRLNHNKDFEKHTQQLYEIISKNPGYEKGAATPLWLKFKSEIDGHSPRAIETLRMIAKVFETQNFAFTQFAEEGLALCVNGQDVDWARGDAVQEALLKIADGYASTAPARTGLIMAEIANFANDHGKPELADAMYLRVVKSQENAKDKGLLIGALGKLAERKIAAGKKADALQFYHSATNAMREKYGNDTRVADAMDSEAALMQELGKEQEAAALKAQAMDVRKKSLGQ